MLCTLFDSMDQIMIIGHGTSPFEAGTMSNTPEPTLFFSFLLFCVSLPLSFSEKFPLLGAPAGGDENRDENL